MMKPLIIYLFLTLMLVSCSANDESTTPMPTDIPPTSTATDTPIPIPSPTSTATPEPTATPDAASLKGLWQTQPDMLYARAAHAVVSTDTAVYALAGTGAGGSPVLEVERFDGNEWALETTLPGNGLNAPAAAVFNERIYLIGGFNTTSNIPTDEVLVYDLASKSWEMAAPLPEPRGGHAATVLDGKIHVVGGGNSQSTLANHSVFNPNTNTWSDLAPLPQAEGSPALVAFAGKLYAIGGRSGFSDFGDVYIYDPATDMWTNGAAIEPRGTAGAVVYCDTINLFCGESQAERQNLDVVFRLDVAEDSWTAVTPMPTARNFARAVLLNIDVYVVGGSLNAGSSHASAGSTVVESFHVDCQS
jgi:N-acetylneuraminic acid mutarotase